MRINKEATVAEKQTLAAKADALTSQLTGATPEQIDTWVDNNLTDLAGARKIIKFLLYLAAAELNK